MPKKRGRFFNNTGITLVELSIAAAVLFVAILPLFLLLNRTIKEVMFYSRSTAATKLGQDLMEEILSMPRWDEYALPGKSVSIVGASPPAATVPGSLGPDGTTDDIDDYNGYNDVQTSGSGIKFNRLVIVDYVDVPNAGLIPGASSTVRTNFKRVRVIVTWPQLDTNFQYRRPVEIMTIVANVDKY